MSKMILLLAMGALIPLLGFATTQAFAAIGNDYFGAYPDIGSKRDALYTFTTCNFAGTSISTSKNNLECIASSDEQDSSGNVNPYMSQVYALYKSSTAHIVFYSEVWGIGSSGNPPPVNSAYSCETTSGCNDLGAASGIGNVKHEQFWSGGKIKYYVEVYNTSGGFVTSYFNPDYTRGADDTSSKFASGTQTVSGYKLKLTQWGVESEEPNPPTGWKAEQSGMSTYNSASSPFSSDTARTTEPTAGTTDGSYITHRVVSGTDWEMKIGSSKNCVHRNNNVAGDIQWQDGGTCLNAGVQLWP